MWDLLNTASGWLSDAVALVERYPDWALAVAFLAAIIEAVAVVGTIIPGTFILMGIAGAAAAAGQPIIPYIVVGIAGAIIGDFVSYWVGFRYRYAVRQWWPLSRHPEMMGSAERFFERYGSYSVALCRFIPVLRSMLPLVAGIAGMNRKRFVVANVASAFVWAPAHVCPAQLAGLSFERWKEGDWQSAAVMATGVLLCAAFVWMLHKRLTPFLLAARR